MHRAPSLRCLIGLTCLTLALGLLPAPARARGEDDDAAAAFRELLRADWDHRMEHSPEEASLLGDRRFNQRWPDLRPRRLRRPAPARPRPRERLRAIDRKGLARADRLNYDLFRRALDEDSRSTASAGT